MGLLRPGQLAREPDLTLNLGLRWDPFFPYWDREGRVVCFAPGQKSSRYPNAPVGVIYGGENHDPGCPKAGTNSEWGNFAPRVGFAYRLTADGKTPSAAARVTTYTPPQASIYNPFANIAPFAPTYSYNDVDFTDPFGSVGIANPFPAQYGPKTPGPEAVFTVPSDLRATFPPGYHIPQLLEWNLMVERQLFRDWLARVGYFGNKGTHFYGNGSGPDRPANAAIYVPGNSTLANIQQRRPYQNFTNVGHHRVRQQHALQFASVEHREAFWSRAVDCHELYVGKAHRRCRLDESVQQGFRLRVADDDVTHVFHFANVYQFPTTRLRGAAGRLVNGWSFNSLVTWQGGFPMTVTSGIDNAFAGSTGNGNRADLRRGQGRSRQLRKISRGNDPAVLQHLGLRDQCAGNLRQLRAQHSTRTAIFQHGFFGAERHARDREGDGAVPVGVFQRLQQRELQQPEHNQDLV